MRSNLKINNLDKVEMWVAVIASFVVFTVLFLTQLNYTYIGIDGGYYLSVARDVLLYKVPFYSINVSYNPLSIIILGLPLLIVKNAVFSIAIMFLSHILNWFLFYKILKYYIPSNSVRIIAASFFLMYSVLMGYTIVLEPIQMTFILLSVLFFLKDKYFASGFIFFLAFYSKQYSLALAVGFGLAILYENNYKIIIKKMAKLLLGFLLALLIFYIIHIKQISFVDYFYRIIGITQTSQGFSKITGVGYSFHDFVSLLRRLATTFPLVLFVFYAIWRIKVNKLNILIIGNLLGFSFVFFFASYLHYVILVLPWILVIIFIYFDEYVKESRILNNLFLIGILFSVILSVFYATRVSTSLKGASLEVQKMSCDLLKIVPPNKKVFIYSFTPILYFTNEYRSANITVLDYTFPNLYPLSYFVKNTQKDAFFVIDSKEYNKNIELFHKYLLIEQKKNITVLEKVSD